MTLGGRSLVFWIIRWKMEVFNMHTNTSIICYSWAGTKYKSGRSKGLIHWNIWLSKLIFSCDGLFAEHMKLPLGWARVLRCALYHFPVKHALMIIFRSRGSFTLRSTWSSYCRLFPGGPACWPPPCESACWPPPSLGRPPRLSNNPSKDGGV